MQYTKNSDWMIVATGCLDQILNKKSFIFCFGQKLTEICITVYWKRGSRTSYKSETRREMSSMELRI